MKFNIEVVPGESIGPFRLGMTQQDIEGALRSLSEDSLTLDDLGIIASFQEEQAPVDQKHCNRLEIRVFNKDCTVLLLGQVVNNISNSDAARLFSSISPDVRHSYACLSIAEAGIEAVRWEHSDEMIYCFFVIPPTASCKDESAPVFGSGPN